MWLIMFLIHHLYFQSIQDKINFCNNYLRTIRPNLFITGRYPMNTLGTHTLGLINNNILLDGTSATSFLQNLDPNNYGTQQLFYSNSPLTNNSINIFTGNTRYIIPEYLISEYFIDGSSSGFKYSEIKYSDIINSKDEYTVAAINKEQYREDVINLINNDGIGKSYWTNNSCISDVSISFHSLHHIDVLTNKNTNTKSAVINILNYLKNCAGASDSSIVIFIELVDSVHGSSNGNWVLPKANYFLNGDKLDFGPLP